MQKVLTEYKGVILFFLVVLIMAGLLNQRVNDLNQMSNNNQVAYYAK